MPIPSARRMSPGRLPVRDLLLPNVVIPGVSHAGVVQLAADLGRHREVCLPGVKRIGHFTPLRYGRPLEAPLEEYDRHFARWSGQRYRLEPGPDYFDGGLSMVQYLAESLPDVRVVVLLREPSCRLWSSYADKLARGRLPRAMTFETYVERCRALRANGADRFEGNRHFRTLSSGFYVDYLPAWIETFGSRARVVFTENFRDGQSEQVGALFHWLGLEPGPVTPAPDDDPSEGYPAPDLEPVLFHRRLRALLRCRRPSMEQGGEARRAPRRCEQALGRVRALYAAPNRDLAALLRDRGYTNLPKWLSQE
jgi:hypothetical protein